MFKIAAFIEFNKKINKKVLDEKKKVRKNFGNQIYLNHPVHLTIFTLKIEKISDLKKIYKRDNFINNSKIITINLNKPGIFTNDPLTLGHTIFYNIKKNKELDLMQVKHLKKINKNIKVLKNDINFFNNSVLKKNYKTYGFPFVNKIWIPHTTIASIKGIESNHKFIKTFLKSKIKMKCFFNEIKFFKINNDKHTFLFSTKNI